MGIASKQFTGSQFALLTSLTSVSRVVLVSQAGVLAEWLGWPMFFAGSVFLAVPGLLLLRRYDGWAVTDSTVLRATVARYDQVVIGIFMTSLICICLDPIWGTLGLAHVGAHVVKVGVAGVVITVLAGLFKPRFSKHPAHV